MQLTTRRREAGNNPVRAVDDETAEAVLEHGPTILRTARRYSVCASDAEDAYQRGVEILLTKAPTTDTAQLVPWLVTVVKNEALAILKQRRRIDRAAFDDGAEVMASSEPLPGERAEDYELIAHGAEALGRLKRDEAKALLLKAEGLSYKEIAQHTGWTYTKVNRCITEGRAAFRHRLSSIQGGGECDRLEPLLSRFADGEASDDERDDVAIHLQNCLACKSSLREFRAAPARVAALFPVPIMAKAGGGPESSANAIQLAWQWVQERAGAASMHLHQWGEVAGAKKVAAVAAAAAVTGGVAVESKIDRDPPVRAKHVAPAPAPVRSEAVAAPRELRPVKSRRPIRSVEAERAPEPVTESEPVPAESAQELQTQTPPEPAIGDGTADLAP